MRAMLLHETAPIAGRPLRLEELPQPEPAPGELLVSVRVCGVCRTDLHVIEGDLPEARRPIVPGHMVVGEVASPGAGAGGFARGDRVGIAWLRGTCGCCDHCEHERANLCEDARFTGYHEHGGYADYATVPAAWAYPLPASLDDVHAAPLLCAGIIGYRALRLSEVEPGGKLGLYGFGNSAHIVLQLARHRGCEVYVASTSDEHREHARELGAVWTGPADEMPEATLDSSILFAPAGELVPPALRALRRGGTLACAGIHMSAIPRIDYDTELFGERTLRSVTANTRADGLDLLREAGEIPLRPEVETLPLEEANEALIRLKEGRVRGAAVLKIERP